MAFGQDDDDGYGLSRPLVDLNHFLSDIHPLSVKSLKRIDALLDRFDEGGLAVEFKLFGFSIATLRIRKQ